VERLFVDTSAWIAFANRGDPDHEAVAEALWRFAGRLVTSNYVFDETVTLARYRLGPDIAVEVGETLQDLSVVDLVQVTVEDQRRAWELFAARRDKDYSFTDCTSFCVMRRLNLARAAALDEDFRREGFLVVPARV
jgi:hypothetical protein